MTVLAALIFLTVKTSLAWKVIALLAGAGLAGTFVTAPQPGPLVATTSPDYDTQVAQAANLPFQYEILTGTTDAIQGGGGIGPTGVVPICGTSFIESGVVNNATLAAPAVGAPSAGGNDGLEITIIDNGGHAHVITTPANVIVGGKHLATFNGTIGSFVTFMARNGKWIPQANSGVVLS